MPQQRWSTACYGPKKFTDWRVLSLASNPRIAALQSDRGLGLAGRAAAEEVADSRRNQEAYFRKCAALLADDGVFLLHSTGRSDGPGITNLLYYSCRDRDGV